MFTGRGMARCRIPIVHEGEIDGIILNIGDVTSM